MLQLLNFETVLHCYFSALT